HYLDRIPAHAAVGEGVELVKQAKKRSAAGFVNAILRKIPRQAPVWPDRSIALSCPEWMLARWTAFWGAGTAESIARAALETPGRYLRFPPGAPIPSGVLPTGISGCFELLAGDQPPPGATLQDIGSQSIVPLLELRPEHRFLDLCAAPGNKTAQALESGAWTVAADSSLKRLLSVQATRVVLDARRPLPFAPAFDRILVDAPCSGTGTLAHNPEIKWRLTPSAIEKQGTQQRRILQQALASLAPGGLLVYSTCSLEPEENEQVIEAVAPHRVVRTVRRLPGQDPGDGFFAAVLR
ncbi:MAG: RsmB/NOP family class I SAM-dependent RNA methyltransferase, partial [Acidobacteriota bacterium]|nr:RsmB/NOP family class I SAM-dependent RNA methyltransferase [Acidobacteriota bacterium]